MSMRTIDVSVAQQGLTLDDAYELLTGMPGFYEKAVKYATKDTMRYFASRGYDEIAKEYSLKQKVIKEHTKLSQKYSYRVGQADAELTYWGNKIGLYQFSGTPPMPPRQNKTVLVNFKGGTTQYEKPSQNAKGHQLRSAALQGIEGAFIGKVMAGDGITPHYGFFQRLDRDKQWWKDSEAIWSEGAKAGTKNTPANTHKIREVYGSAVPQMIGKDKLVELLQESASKRFEDRLAHYVELGMNGFAWWKRRGKG